MHAAKDCSQGAWITTKLPAMQGLRDRKHSGCESQDHLWLRAKHRFGPMARVCVNERAVAVQLYRNDGAIYVESDFHR